jgi:hypothetical protein
MGLSNSLPLGNNVYDPRLQYERQLAQQQMQPIPAQPGAELSKTGEPMQQSPQQIQQAQQRLQQSQGQLSQSQQSQSQQSPSQQTPATQQPQEPAREQQVAIAPEASAAPGGFGAGGAGGGGGGRGGARGARAGRGGRGGGGGGAFGGGFARSGAAPAAESSPSTSAGAGLPALPAAPAAVLEPGNGSLYFGVAQPLQQERRIVVKRITRRQASEIQTVLDVIRLRNQSPSIGVAEPLTLTLRLPSGPAASLNGFPSIDDFTASRMRELSAQNAFAAQTTASAAVSTDGATTAPATTAPATAPAASVAMASPTTAPTIDGLARLRSADFSLAPPPTATVDLKSLPTTRPDNALEDRDRLAAMPTTQSADELLDLVILVQPLPAPSTQPTTAPAPPQ